MSEPVFHRLHPLTMAVELEKMVRQLAIAFAYLIYILITKESSDQVGYELFAAGLGVLVIVPAILRYYSYGYSVTDGKLLVKSGIFRKSLRTIPLDRIQNINLKRQWLHRLLGLVELEIETAAGAQAEATINALNEEQAHILKSQLLGQKATVYSRIDRGDEELMLYKPSNWELFLVGASENRAGAMIAALLGLSFFQPMFTNFMEKRSDEVVKQATHLPPNVGLMIGLGIFVFLLFGWVISIVSTFIKYYGFKLTEKDGKLKRSYGLINHFENMLPVKRVQTVHIDQNFIQRWLKICKMYVATAGGMAMASGGEHQKQHQHSHAPPLLSPVLRDDMRGRLLQASLPKYDLMHPEYHEVSSGTIWRHVRSGFMGSFFSGGLLAFGGQMLIWFSPEQAKKLSLMQLRFGPVGVFLGLLALAGLTGWLYLRFARWSETNSVIATRLGWFKTRWNFLPMAKIQLTEVTQSPAQRWFGLGTVRFHSAAPAFKITEIDDLKLVQAYDLANRTHDKAGESHDSLFDGF
ncbi:MAG: PH domain-containing protein [Fimbriimonadaceae bacterium]